MKSIGIAAVAACGAFVLGAASAGASELLFTFNDQQGDVVSWEQPSDPTPLSVVPGQTTVIGITDYQVLTYNPSNPAFPPETSMDYFSLVEDAGGLESGSGRLNYLGAQVYTGTEAAPQFSTGTFDMSPDGVLTVTDVPEPAAWALMLAGVAGIGAMVRYRRTRMALAQA